jgi:hypothetical protein
MIGSNGRADGSFFGFRHAQTGYWREGNSRSAPIGQFRKYEEDSLHAGRIAVEVWVLSRFKNRINFLNAWQEYGDRKSDASTKKKRK